jgi:hypothetical protein
MKIKFGSLRLSSHLCTPFRKRVVLENGDTIEFLKKMKIKFGSSKIVTNFALPFEKKGLKKKKRIDSVL